MRTKIALSLVEDAPDLVGVCPRLNHIVLEFAQLPVNHLEVSFFVERAEHCLFEVVEFILNSVYKLIEVSLSGLDLFVVVAHLVVVLSHKHVVFVATQFRGQVLLQQVNFGAVHFALE